MKVNYSDEQFYYNCFKENENKPLKTLIALYKGNYYKFLLSCFFFIVKHSPVWLLPIVTANIINGINGNGTDTMSHIIVNCGILIFLLILNIPMNYLHTMFKSLAVRNVEAGLRGAIVRKLQQLSISFHTSTQSGRLQSKIMRDVESVETVSTQLFVGLLNIFVNIAVALYVTISRSFIVFLFFLFSVPTAAITIVLFRKRIKKTNGEFRQEMENTSAQVMEMVELIPITRAHALEEEETVRMSEQLSLVAEKGYKLDMIQAVFGAVSWAIFQVFQVGCLLFTAYLAFKGRILAGDILIYQSYFITIVNQISSLIMLFPTIAKGLESIKSIGEVILSNEVENNDGKEKVDNITGQFDFCDVSFSYGEKEVLKGLELHIKPGETIAFVGESGAGKTTILNMVIGFIKANTGKLLLDGRDLTTLDLRSYRHHLAVVPQNTILFSGSIRDNITYGLSTVPDDVLMKVIEASNLKEFIDSLPDGLDTHIGEHGGKLSGGQRQRIAIARALIRDPSVIVLDEATSALDSISEKLIQEALGNLTEGRTTFIVAHRLSTIKDADKIAVIDDGKCVEYGTFDELMALKGNFYNMKVIQS